MQFGFGSVLLIPNFAQVGFELADFSKLMTLPEIAIDILVKKRYSVDSVSRWLKQFNRSCSFLISVNSLLMFAFSDHLLLEIGPPDLLGRLHRVGRHLVCPLVEIS